MYRPFVGERVELINDFTGLRIGFGIVDFIDPDLDHRFVIVKEGEQRPRFYHPDQLKKVEETRKTSDPS